MRGGARRGGTRSGPRGDRFPWSAAPRSRTSACPSPALVPASPGLGAGRGSGDAGINAVSGPPTRGRGAKGHPGEPGSGPCPPMAGVRGRRRCTLRPALRPAPGRPWHRRADRGATTGHGSLPGRAGGTDPGRLRRAGAEAPGPGPPDTPDGGSGPFRNGSPAYGSEPGRVQVPCPAAEALGPGDAAGEHPAGAAALRRSSVGAAPRSGRRGPPRPVRGRTLPEGCRVSGRSPGVLG